MGIVTGSEEQDPAQAAKCRDYKEKCLRIWRYFLRPDQTQTCRRLDMFEARQIGCTTGASQIHLDDSGCGLKGPGTGRDVRVRNTRNTTTAAITR